MFKNWTRIYAIFCAYNVKNNQFMYIIERKDYIMKSADSNKKADKILSNIDSDILKNGMEKLKGMSEGEAKKLKEQLESIDKDKVLRMLGSLSPETIKEKMSGLDFSKLGDIAKNSDAISKLKKDKNQR